MCYKLRRSRTVSVDMLIYGDYSRLFSEDGAFSFVALARLKGIACIRLDLVFTALLLVLQHVRLKQLYRAHA